MSLTPQHRALIAQHGDSVADVRGRWSVDFDEHGIAAFIVAVERAARVAEREAMIAEADATVDKLRALHKHAMGYEDACVARGAELVADALRARCLRGGER